MGNLLGAKYCVDCGCWLSDASFDEGRGRCYECNGDSDSESDGMFWNDDSDSEHDSDSF